MPAPQEIRDLKVFVPSQDHEVSKAFYQELGFQLNWQVDGLAELQAGEHRFLLQKYYQKDWAENFMFQLVVGDAQAWYDHIREAQLPDRYDNVRVSPPKDEPWGMKVVYLWGPAGELWHLSQPLPESEEA